MTSLSLSQSAFTDMPARRCVQAGVDTPNSILPEEGAMLFMTIVAKSLSSAPAVIVRAAGTVVTQLTGFGRAMLHRREVMRLGELDERELKDIGLVRSDLNGALASSWLTDPSAILAARSRAGADVANARRQQAVRLSESGPVMASPADHILARCA
jgi:uncharacterized protein YjiS (DUF1127 family)